MVFPVGVSTFGSGAHVLVFYITMCSWSLLSFLLYLVLRRARAMSGHPAVPLGRCGVI